MGVRDFENFYGAAGAKKMSGRRNNDFRVGKHVQKLLEMHRKQAECQKKFRCAAPVRRYHLGNEFVCKPVRGWYASVKALGPANSPAILGRANSRNNGSERHGRPPESHEVRAFLSKAYCACVSGMRMSWHCAAHRS